MNHFSRLVHKSGSVVTLSSITVLLGSAALTPATFAAQLLEVLPDPSALMIHSSQGYLGIEMRDVDNDRATALKLKTVTGAEVTVVDHDAPAGKVGLRVHDVILEMNGQQIQGVEQLRRMLRETPAGRSVALVIWRDGQQQTINVQLADRAKIEQDAWNKFQMIPEPPDDSDFVLSGPSGHVAGGNGFFGAFVIGTSSVGVDLDPLGTQLADYFGVKDGQGLLVKRVAENSPASTAGLKAGDVITKVNGESIPTLNSWAKVIHANRGKQVQVTIVRNHKEQTLSLQAGETKHKGELVVPDVEVPDAGIEILGPGVDGNLARLDLDAAALADQTVRELDLPKLELQLKELQLRDQGKQLQLLQKNLQPLVIVPGFRDMY